MYKTKKLLLNIINACIIFVNTPYQTIPWIYNSNSLIVENLWFGDKSI